MKGVDSNGFCLGSEFKNSENNTHTLNRSIKEGNERNIKLYTRLCPN